MRLFLAVAVLMLAFVAYTEAQDDTMKQKLNEFGEQISELGRNWASSAQDAFQHVRNGAKNAFEAMKAKWGDITS